MVVAAVTGYEGIRKRVSSSLAFFLWPAWAVLPSLASLPWTPWEPC